MRTTRHALTGSFSLAILACLLSLAPSAHADMVYSTFTPFDGSGVSNTGAINVGNGNFASSFSTLIIGAKFIPTADYLLSSIDIPLSHTNGPNLFNIQVRGETPTGNVLASALTAVSTVPDAITTVSLPPISLTAGTPYYLFALGEILPTDAGSGNDGTGGSWSASSISSISNLNGTYIGSTNHGILTAPTLGLPGTTPAFRVNGRPASSIPEPGTLVFGVLGLSLGVLRRRKA
jgi:hypothetical protein